MKQKSQMARFTRSSNRKGAIWFTELCRSIDAELKNLTENGEYLPNIVMMTSAHKSSHGGCLSTAAIKKIFDIVGDGVMRDASVFVDFGSGIGQVTTYIWGVYRHVDVYAIECDESRVLFQQDRLQNYPYDKSRFNVVQTDWTLTYKNEGMWDFLTPEAGYGIVFVNNLNMYEIDVLGRLRDIIEVHAKEGTYVVTLSPMFGRSRRVSLSKEHHVMRSRDTERGMGIPICVGNNEVSWVGGTTTLTMFVYRINSV